MIQNPMHILKVEHNWANSESIRRFGEDGALISTRTCSDCGVKQDALDLRTTRSEHPNEYKDDSQGFIDSARQMIEATSQVAKSIKDYEQGIFANSRFLTVDGFTDHISTFYEKSVSGGDINYRTIEYYLELERKQTPKTARNKSLRKLLLHWKQSPVCNRCDSIFPWSQLTEDHVIPRSSGGQTKLKNLQLLCKPCNWEKSNQMPSCKDESPFVYDGEPCIHIITCNELTQKEN